jgi:hypothetical protein
MSKEDVASFFDQMAGAPDDDGPSPDDPTVNEIIAHADALGFAFTETELRSHMKDLLYTARSLPEVWGWPLARTLGLARK